MDFLRPLISGLAATALRFPLPLCAALLFCGTAIGDNHNWLPTWIDNEFTLRLNTLAVLGFFWTLSARLFAESRGWGNVRQFGLAAAGVGLLILKIFLDQPTLQFGNVVFLALGPAMVLLVMAAPFLFRASGPEAFWDFNRTAWLGAALAFLAALILASGLMFAIWAIEELFGWNLSWRIEGDIWILALALFCPWLSLARIPRRFDAPDGAVCPRALSVLIAYVLVPLAIGYAVIVYAYIARILVLWELPRGQVATIVCGYAGFGLVTYLAAWPLRGTGPVHVRLFHRFFFYALLPPVGLLAVAVAERLSTYGVTEPRYVLAAIAAWMAAVTAGFLWKRDIGLPVVPAALAVLMVAASFGPWGAADVSLRSQSARLVQLLTDEGLFADGHIVRSPIDDAIASSWQRQQIVSIVRYLDRTGRLDAVEGWFEDGVISADPRPDEVLAAISQDVDWHGDGITVGFDYQAAAAMPVGGYDRLMIVPVSLYSAGAEGGTTTIGGTTLLWSYDWSTGTLSLNFGEDDKLAFDVAELANDLYRRLGDDWADVVTPADMTVDDSVGGHDVRFSVQRLEGSLTDGNMSLFEADIVVLFRMADSAGSPEVPPG